MTTTPETSPETGSATPDSDTAEPGTAPTDNRLDDQPGGTEDDLPDRTRAYVTKLRAEAAAKRTRLKALQDELFHANDAVRYLTERMQVAQRREAENLAAERGLIEPTDLWARGIDLGDLLTDNGDIDPAKVRAAVDSCPPHWQRRVASRYGKPVSGASSPDLDHRTTGWDAVVHKR